MGWDYYNHMAYGVKVTSWGNTEIKSLLAKYKDILEYDRNMSDGGMGTIFVYVKSTYKILDEDHGSYAGGRLDTEGDDFNPPRHECFFHVDYDRGAPTLTVQERAALDEVQTLSGNKCCWVHDASISFMKEIYGI